MSEDYKFQDFEEWMGELFTDGREEEMPIISRAFIFGWIAGHAMARKGKAKMEVREGNEEHAR